MLTRTTLTILHWWVLAFAGASLGTAAEKPNPGAWSVGFRRVTISRPDATTFRALVWHPAASAGINVPLAPGRPFPLVVFGHGFQSPPVLYAQTLQHLSSWGFVVCAPESGLELFPSHAAFGKDFSITADWFAAEAERTNSVWFQRVDVGRLGFSGHSMGGGCAVLAAADEGPRLQAVITLAVAETRPSAAVAAARIAAPHVAIVGSADRIVPWLTNSRPVMLRARPPVVVWNILGGAHCGFLDQPFPYVCDQPKIPQVDQLAMTRSLLVDGFQAFLQDDAGAVDRLWTTNPPGVRIERRDAGVMLERIGFPRPIWLTSAAPKTIECLLTNTSPTRQRLRIATEDQHPNVSYAIDPAVSDELEPGASVNVSVTVRVFGERPGLVASEARLVAEPVNDQRFRSALLLKVRGWVE